MIKNFKEQEDPQDVFGTLNLVTLTITNGQLVLLIMLTLLAFANNHQTSTLLW
jgi:hypothetical protein